MTGLTLQKRLASNLKALRKGRFTQETLAEATGLSSQMINNIEGCRRWPSEETLAKIADALDTDVQNLFVPVNGESNQAADLYRLISDKIIEDVKIAIEKSLEDFRKKQ